jgi:hypothetical protein
MHVGEVQINGGGTEALMAENLLCAVTASTPGSVDGLIVISHCHQTWSEYLLLGLTTGVLGATERNADLGIRFHCYRQSIIRGRKQSRINRIPCPFVARESF